MVLQHDEKVEKQQHQDAKKAMLEALEAKWQVSAAFSLVLRLLHLVLLFVFFFFIVVCVSVRLSVCVCVCVRARVSVVCVRVILSYRSHTRLSYYTVIPYSHIILSYHTVI